jgi:formylglycine-generating enzyme required for sulfatase activity
LEVEAGAYDRTYTNAGTGASGLGDPATISRFKLDKYEVTVGRFRQFVSAWNTGFRPEMGSGKHFYLNGGNGVAAGPNVDAGQQYEPGWVVSDDSNVTPTDSNLACSATYATWTPTAGENESLPIGCVNWWEAYAFCIWDLGFLPTESEWEYAAAGGTEQLEYPWGSTDPGTTNLYAIYDCYYPNGSGDCTGFTNASAVGYAVDGAGRWGQIDLAGNVWEWNLDWFAPYVSPCTDCAQLTAASYRVGRGGGFVGSEPGLVPPDRYTGFSADARDYALGFRCARAP